MEEHEVLENITQSINAMQRKWGMDEWDRIFGICLAAAQNFAESYDSKEDKDFLNFSRRLYKGNKGLEEFIEELPNLSWRDGEPVPKTEQKKLLTLTAQRNEKEEEKEKEGAKWRKDDGEKMEVEECFRLGKAPDWVNEVVVALKNDVQELEETKKWTMQTVFKELYTKETAALIIGCLSAMNCENDFYEQEKRRITRRMIVENEDVFLRKFFLPEEEDYKKNKFQKKDQWSLWKFAESYYRQAQKHLLHGGTMQDFFDHHDAQNKTKLYGQMCDVVKSAVKKKELSTKREQCRAIVKSLPLKLESQDQNKPTAIKNSAEVKSGKVISLAEHRKQRK